MQIGSILKFALLGGAGYYAYRAFANSPGAAASSIGIPDLAAAAGGSGVNAPASGPGRTADSPAVQTQKIVAKAGVGPNQLYTASEWTWFWNSVYGDSGVPVFLGDDGSPMSVSDYMGLRVKKGFSGLGALPVPLVFALGVDRRPMLLVPRGRRVGVR